MQHFDTGKEYYVLLGEEEEDGRESQIAQKPRQKLGTFGGAFLTTLAFFLLLLMFVRPCLQSVTLDREY